MNSPSVNFDDKKIKKNIFCRSRKPFNVSDIDVNRILISNEVVYGTKNSLKYFIGYNDEKDVIRPLLLKLPQMIGYLKEFDDSMTVSLRVDNSKLFKNCCRIWKAISGLLGVELDSELVYGDTDSYIKTKVKMYDNRVTTNFQDRQVLKKDVLHKFLSLIMLDSVVKVGKKYYLQVFLEECKCVRRKNKLVNYINDDIEITSSDENDEFYSESDSDSNNKSFLFSLFFLYNFFDILSFFLFFLLKYCFSFFLCIFLIFFIFFFFFF